MEVRIKIEFTCKNGVMKDVVIMEKDPKGILRDRETGSEREIVLTDKEVIMEYTKKISDHIQEGKNIFFKGEDDRIIILNPSEIATVELNLVGIRAVDKSL